MDFSKYKVALVCDWLTSPGGAAKVEEAMAEAFPQADVFSSVVKPGVFDWLKGRKVTTGWLNRIPLLKYKHQLWPVFRPVVFENFNLSDYDIVISSSSAEAKNIITKPWTRHFCYCHTPIRYYWSDYHDYLDRMEFGWLNPLIRLSMPYWVHGLRQTDRLAAERVDYFIANSSYVGERIKKYYRRPSEVIYPPVDLAADNFGLKSEDQGYYLYVGRLIPYKKADLIVRAFVTNGLSLKVAGSGPELGKLKKLAADSANIEILTDVDDEAKRKLLAGCRALIFPSLEDFGIVPLEAMSFGKPVLAYGVGGALETVIPGKTGQLFFEQTPASLNSALEGFKPDVSDPQTIRDWVAGFSKERFKKQLKEYIWSKLDVRRN